MNLPVIYFDSIALRNFDDAIRKEWIITNGLGGYASSTILGINTRKYHGLLVAALLPPQDRRVFLENLNEDLIISEENESIRLGTDEFQNTIYPNGYQLLKEVNVGPFPTSLYQKELLSLEKTVFMSQGLNATFILYKIGNAKNTDVKLRIWPSINWRPFHHTTSKSSTTKLDQKNHENDLLMTFSSPESVLGMRAIEGIYHASERWIEKVFYREEKARGEASVDDNYQPGYFEFHASLGKQMDCAVIAVAGRDEIAVFNLMEKMPTTIEQVKNLYENEKAVKKQLLTHFFYEHPRIDVSDWLSWLVLAADSFIVEGVIPAEKWIIAGYYWFDIWGRDTFISLPGLLLLTRRFQEARHAFSTFLRYLREGVIPNCFVDPKVQLYNSVDATLWLINSVLQYLKYTADFAFVKTELWELLKTALSFHLKGTFHGIKVDDDGLLAHGAQLTWMDAILERPFTPRGGKAVEIQGLWYNALKVMELLAQAFDEHEQASSYVSLAEKTKKSFNEKFWNAEKNCCFDVIENGFRDGSLRPNQIINASLDFSILNQKESEKIVNFVHNQFLTPRGLRTLSKYDDRYIGMCVGDRSRRDLAYHNGTVWPWLLGPLTRAYLKVKGYSSEQRDFAFRNFLLPLFSQGIYEGGIGTLNEIFDGDSPHLARGCISQAWSVAEPLRAYVEEIMLIRPKFESEVLKSLV